MPEGLIIKALSGYYYVKPEDNQLPIVQCRARGLFKKKGISPLVGDHVFYETTENGEGTVTQIKPRFSELIRPPVANVDLALLVFSLDEPALNLSLLDKFLVHTEKAGLESVICLSKFDLMEVEESVPVAGNLTLKAIIELYEDIGYKVLLTSTKAGLGGEEVMACLKDRVTVVAGQSGVGKSSLLNMLIAGIELETAPISMKLGRGKHTTRHVELIPLAQGGWVADTPGFSQLDFQGIEKEQLTDYFKDFSRFSQNCKFRGCLHLTEPGCRVTEAREQGLLAVHRYAHYVQFLEEIKDQKRRY